MSRKSEEITQALPRLLRTGGDLEAVIDEEGELGRGGAGRPGLHLAGTEQVEHVPLPEIEGVFFVRENGVFR